MHIDLVVTALELMKKLNQRYRYENIISLKIHCNRNTVSVYIHWKNMLDIGMYILNAPMITIYSILFSGGKDELKQITAGLL